MSNLKIIAGWFGSVLNWRSVHEADKRLQKKTALMSLMAAATETRHYLAAVRADRASHNDATENHLAQLWSKAGVDMTDVDRDLAIRYLMKADYWSDPKGWTETEKDDRLIQLDEVLLLGQAALLPPQD